MTKIIDRTGEVSYTKYGTKAVIVEYVNYGNVLIEFQDNYKYRYRTSYANFSKGHLTNPYECRNKGGIGFIGVGKYNSKDHKLAYYKWNAIIQRCIKTNYKDKSLESYLGCEICEEWLNFQKFAEWFYDEYYECNEPLCVDKDILIHGNRVYSPETCLLVPQRINLLFIKELKRRGDTPIGAQKNTRGDGYISVLSKGVGNNVYLGHFSNSYDAHIVYKHAKEKYIKEIADEYSHIIPKKVYDAMYQYEISIND